MEVIETQTDFLVRKHGNPVLRSNADRPLGIAWKLFATDIPERWCTWIPVLTRLHRILEILVVRIGVGGIKANRSVRQTCIGAINLYTAGHNLCHIACRAGIVE